MDKTLLWTAFLCVATLVAYADELGMLLRLCLEGPEAVQSRRQKRMMLELARADLTSRDPARMDRALWLLERDNGPESTAELVALLSHPDPTLAQRAARVLHQRQDPAGTEPLYRYLARPRGC